MSLLWIAAKAKYFHASHADLPVGTILEQRGSPLNPDAPRGVYMSRDLDTAHDWAHLLDRPHVYEVEPMGDVEKRYQKDALSKHEWIAPNARITRKVGEITPADEYCDGCI